MFKQLLLLVIFVFLFEVMHQDAPREVRISFQSCSVHSPLQNRKSRCHELFGLSACLNWMYRMSVLNITAATMLWGRTI